jgi:hypothetical protein
MDILRNSVVLFGPYSLKWEQRDEEAIQLLYLQLHVEDRAAASGGRAHTGQLGVAGAPPKAFQTLVQRTRAKLNCLVLQPTADLHSRSQGEMGHAG